MKSMAAKKKVTKKKAVKKKPAAKPEGYTFGRPTEYKPEYCEVAIEALKKGFSKEAVAGHIGICKDTLYKWIKRHKDFADAIAQGVELSRIHWEKIAIDHVVFSKNGVQISPQVWSLNMKNRFGWSEKKEIELGEETRATVKLAYSLDEADDE